MSDTLGRAKVIIGASIDDFMAAMGKVDKSLKEAADKTKDFGKGMTDAGIKIGAAGAVITTALGLALKSTADAGDAFYDLSQKTGISAEVLSSYKLAADSSGTSIQGFATGMRGLSNAMADANKEGSDSAKAFKALGVTTVDSTGKARNMNAVFLDVADRFSKMEDGAVKTRMATQLFGKSGMELIPMLNLGKAGLSEFTEKAKKLGIVFTDNAAKAADDFNDSLDELRAAFSGVSKTIGTTLMDSLSGLVKAFTGIVATGGNLLKALGPIGELAIDLAAGFGVLATATGGTIVAVSQLIKNLPLLKEAAKQLGLGAGALTKDIDSLGSGLKALPLVGAAAFTGWKIGEAINELTGLKKLFMEMPEAYKATEIAESNAMMALQQLRQEGDLAGVSINKLKAKYGTWQAALEAVTSGTDKATAATIAANKASKNWTDKLVDTAIPAQRSMAGVVMYTTDKLEDHAYSLTELGETAIPKARDMTKDFSVAEVEAAKKTEELTETQKDGAEAFMRIQRAIADVIGILETLGITTDEQTKRVTEDFLNMMESASKIIGPGGLNPVALIDTIVSIGKAFADFFGSTKQGFQVVQDELRELGEVSESTAKQIAEDAALSSELWKKVLKSLGESVRDVTKDEADAIAVTQNLNAVMRDTGITLDNITKYWGLALDAINQYSAGQLTANETSAVLDEAFAQLLAAAQKFGEEGSAAMVAFILKTREAGLEIPSITAYINEQLGLIQKGSVNAADGLLAMVAAIAPGSTELSASNEKLKKELADVQAAMAGMGDTGSEDYLKLRDKAIQLSEAIAANEADLSKMGAEGEAALKRVENQTLAVFNAMIVNGASVADATASIGPALDLIIQKHKDLGTEASPAIEKLLKIRGVTESHKELMTAIEGNDAVLKALGNTGFLNQESLNDAAASAADYYDQLIAAGMDGSEALAMMGPTLSDINDYAKTYGLTLDDDTAKMVEAAKKAGIIKEKVDMGEEAKTTNKLLGDMRDIFQEIADKLNIVLDKIGLIPKDVTTTVNVEYNDPGHRIDLDTGDGDDDGSIIGAQHGFSGTVTGPKLFYVEPGVTEDVNIGKPGTAGAGAVGGGGMSVEPTINININAVDSQDVYRLFAGPGRDALVQIVKANVRGITREIAAETKKYSY